MRPGGSTTARRAWRNWRRWSVGTAIAPQRHPLVDRQRGTVTGRRRRQRCASATSALCRMQVHQARSDAPGQLCQQRQQFLGPGCLHDDRHHGLQLRQWRPAGSGTIPTCRPNRASAARMRSPAALAAFMPTTPTPASFRPIATTKLTSRGTAEHYWELFPGRGRGSRACSSGPVLIVARRAGAYRDAPTANRDGGLDPAGSRKTISSIIRLAGQTKPMVHLLPHWNWAVTEGQEIRCPLPIVANCDANGTVPERPEHRQRQAMPRRSHLPPGRSTTPPAHSWPEAIAVRRS